MTSPSDDSSVRTVTALEYMKATRRYEVSTREMLNAGGGLYLVLAGRRSDIDHCQDLAIKNGFVTERTHPTKLVVKGLRTYGTGSTFESSEQSDSRLTSPPRDQV